MEYLINSRNMKRLDYILVKPAGSACNLACAYCFYHDNKESRGIKRMSSSVLREMIKQCLSGSGEASADENFVFCWQGGEPTLAGLDFYKEVIELQKEYGKGKIIGNAIQTNGQLINEDWVAFFKKYRFMVGLSLDGPEDIHNEYRTDRKGRGAWFRTEATARELLSQGIAVNSMTVVNNVTAEHPGLIYGYLKDLGFRWMQFMPCLEAGNEGIGKDRSDGACVPAHFSVSPDAYGSFLCTLFDCWTADFHGSRAAVSIRLFDSVAAVYAGLPATQCTNRFECGDYVVVEADGSVYSCDFFVEENWRLGNLTETPLPKLLNSETQKRFGRQKAELVPGCSECRWLKFCRGGCLKDRMRLNAGNGQNYFCPSYMTFFEYADRRFREIAECIKA